MTSLEQAEYFAASKRPFLTKKRLSVSDWADENRFLSTKSSAFAGRWQTDKVPYQRVPMDCFSDYKTREIVLMWASQLGKGEVALNCMGWAAVNQPGPSLLLQEKDELSKDFKRRRFDPMREECGVLVAIIPDKKKRDGENSEDHVGFPGGSIDFRGIQNTGKVKSVPVRYLFADEIDDWKRDIGSKDNEQGDPLELAAVRTSQFPHNKKILLTSTPTTESSSRIWRHFQRSTQEHYYVPCPNPECRHPQVMSFDRFNREDLTHSCEACSQAFGQAKWYAQQRNGFWKEHAKSKRVRGFWLNVLYSATYAWEELVEDWNRAEERAKEGDESALKTFVNSRKCELWYNKGGNRVKHDYLWEKRIVYPSTVPDEVLMLTAAIDYQSGDKKTGEGAKLKYSIYGWGLNRTGYLIEADTIWGGADNPEALKRVDELVFERSFEKANGDRLGITRMFFDAGNLPDYVYEYCARKQPKAFPIKGIGGNGRPIIKMSKQEGKKAPLVLVGVDTIKDLFQAKFRVDPQQPGSINFPKMEDGSASAGADEEFFKELTAEYRVSEFKNGFHYFVWEKPSSADNDFGDCLVYAFAALEAAGGNEMLRKLADGSEKKVYRPQLGMIQTAKPDDDQEPGPLRPLGAKKKEPDKPGVKKPITFRRYGRFQMPG